MSFNNEVTGCDGSQQSVIDSAYCEIPKENLAQSPHDIPWGSNLYIKVVAENSAGQGPESDLSAPVYYERIPDAPVIEQDLTQSTANQITVKWYAPVETGGNPLLDYSLFWDAGLGGAFSTIQSGLTVTEYTMTGLTTGTTYRFKV